MAIGHATKNLNHNRINAIRDVPSELSTCFKIALHSPSCFKYRTPEKSPHSLRRGKFNEKDTSWGRYEEQLIAIPQCVVLLFTIDLSGPLVLFTDLIKTLPSEFGKCTDIFR